MNLSNDKMDVTPTPTKPNPNNNRIVQNKNIAAVTPILYPDGKKPKYNDTKTTPEDKTVNSIIYQEFNFDTSDTDTQNEENAQLRKTEVIETYPNNEFSFES